MLSCKEVTRLTASDELKDAGLRRRLAARVHLMLCSACRRYASQIRTLGSLARRCAEPGPEEAATLERLRSSILRQGRDEENSPRDGS